MGLAKYSCLSFVFSLMVFGPCENIYANELKGIIGLGVGDGGDTLYHGYYYSTGDYAPVKAGGDIAYFLGLQFHVDETSKVRTLLGIKQAQEGASNGEVKFRRAFIDAIYLKNFAAHNLGFGGTYHTDVQFKCDLVDICDYKVKYDDSLGVMVLYEYDFAYNTSYPIFLGVKYEYIEYTPKSADPVVDGSSLGIYIGGAF
jgi:hypothetical protein